LSGIEFLFDIGLIIITAAFAAYFAKLTKQPPILFYVLAGLIVGPFGLSLLENRVEINALSELGVAFLLFGAAVEINLLKLRGIGLQSLFAVLLQVPLTFLLGYEMAISLGLAQIEGIYIGLVVCFSSTMIVVKLLQDMHKLNTIHARLEIALLVLQDVAVILALAYLNTFTSSLPMSIAFIQTAIGGVGLFAIAIVMNLFVFPPLLRFIARAPEALFLVSVATAFIFMWIAYSLGFSVAIGAFVAGISLSTFPYNLEVAGRVRSLRDFFAAIFFVSLGMQLSPALSWADWQLAIAFTLFVLVVKPVVITAIYILLKFSPRVSFFTGIGLAQISEFSFIIALQGLAAGFLSPELFSVITVSTMSTIVITPYFVRYETQFYDFIASILRPFGASHWFTGEHYGDLVEKKKLKDHIIILGAHRMGNALVEDLSGDNLLIVDYNPDIIERLTKKGVDCIYADAYSPGTLEHLNIEKARMLVSALPDENISLNVIQKAKRMNKKIMVVVRADFAQDALKLYKAGADLVILPDMVAGEFLSDEITSVLRNKASMDEIRTKHVELMCKQADFDQLTDLTYSIHKEYKSGEKVCRTYGKVTICTPSDKVSGKRFIICSAEQVKNPKKKAGKKKKTKRKKRKKKR